MSDKELTDNMMKELSKHYPEERAVLALMMTDKLTGHKTSKNDYKKLIKIQKKLRTRRIKNER